ncbi:hypothetical protein Tco_0983486, partial [Tanacetum coccineum]
GGGGSGGVEERVEESEYGDRVDPGTRNDFGLGRKCPPENFSGGGWPEKVAVVVVPVAGRIM